MVGVLELLGDVVIFGTGYLRVRAGVDVLYVSH